MLIRQALEKAKANGFLVPAKSIAAWEGEPRIFLMCQPLMAAIAAGSVSGNESVRKRWAQLEADIGYFVEGRWVTQELMKQLEPTKFEHWELRSRRPKPSLRVFGRFALPDVFVGTHVVQRQVLGGKWTLDWEIEKLRCEDIWKSAGLGEPFQGQCYEDYITFNAQEKMGI